MNRITFSFEILVSIIAAAILQTCQIMPLTQCEKPTLDPPGGSGPQGGKITVIITTKTIGAYLSWTDDNSIPSPTHGNIIKAPSGPAPTVYGRTLRAIAFKTGLDNSPIAVGDYASTRANRSQRNQ
jgi:hypothetical protein